MRNNKGYALIYVLGAIAAVLFMVATLTRFTSQRLTNIVKNAAKEKDERQAKMKIDVASMLMIRFFEDELVLLQGSQVIPLEEMLLSSKLHNKLSDIEDEIGVLIKQDTMDVTYSAKFFIEATVNEVTAQRPFYLTNLPSFLHFALGSHQDMYLYGGLNVDGDVYVRNTLYLSNEINYTHEKNLYHQPSDKMKMNETNHLYVNQTVRFCDYNLNRNCFTKNDINPLMIERLTNNFNQVDSQETFNQAFSGVRGPRLLTYNHRFLPINISGTYNYYLNKIDEKITLSPNDFRDTVNHPELNTSIHFQDDLLINHDFIMLNKDLFDELLWVIVDGDLEISNLRTNPITIDANFLVKGNVKITGNVRMESIIYSLNDDGTGEGNGETLIDSGSIRKLEVGFNEEEASNPLVLFSKGNIRISKINSFVNKFVTIDNPNLEGFFVSEKNLELYAVSSYIVLNGGIFALAGKNQHIEEMETAKDSHGLMINAYRGKTRLDGPIFDFKPDSEILQSRFSIKYSYDLLENQPKGLPLTNEFNYLFGEITIK